MTESLTIQGRCLSPADLQSLRQWVGVTAGRSRQDRYTCLRVPVKDIYLYALRCGSREVLRA